MNISDNLIIAEKSSEKVTIKTFFLDN